MTRRAQEIHDGLQAIPLDLETIVLCCATSPERALEFAEKIGGLPTIGKPGYSDNGLAAPPCPEPSNFEALAALSLRRWPLATR